MKYLIVAGVTAIVLSGSVDAATWRSLSAGPELAFPVGEMGNSVGQGVGVSGRVEIVRAWSLIYGVGAGYLTFAEKDPLDTSMDLIPLEGVIRYRLGGGLFYGSLQAGVQFRKTTDIVNGERTDIKPTAMPGVGVFLPLGEMTALDITGQFALLPLDTQYIGIRAAIMLGL